MAIDKIQSESINLADTFAFTGTVTGAGEKNAPYFARYSNTQGIPTATETLLQFAGAIVDSASAWNSSSYRWVPQTAGKYFVYAYGVIMSDADFDIAQIRIRKNGSTRIAEHQAANRFYDTHYISAVVTLNGSSDYVDCTAYHEKGSQLDFGNGQIYVSNFGGWLISAT